MEFCFIYGKCLIFALLPLISADLRAVLLLSEVDGRTRCKLPQGKKTICPKVACRRVPRKRARRATPASGTKKENHPHTGDSLFLILLSNSSFFFLFITTITLVVALAAHHHDGRHAVEIGLGHGDVQILIRDVWGELLRFTNFTKTY